MKDNNEKMVTNVPYDEYSELVKFKEKTLEGSLRIYDDDGSYNYMQVVNDEDDVIKRILEDRDATIKELKSEINYLKEKASKSKSFFNDKRVIAACLVVMFCLGVLFTLTFL